MQLFLIEQNVNTGYDTYDSAVVRASSSDFAQYMHPAGGDIRDADKGWFTWATDSKDVTVTLIGDCPIGETAVICASFNAG